jgi:hypothetical protein
MVVCVSGDCVNRVTGKPTYALESLQLYA